MKLTPAERKALLRLIDLTRNHELTCEDFLARVAGYVEKLAKTPTGGEGSEELQHHLEVCPECLEEFEALLRTLDSDQDQEEDENQER